MSNWTLLSCPAGSRLQALSRWGTRVWRWATGVLLLVPSTVFARIDHVDTLKSPGGNEDATSAAARFVYNYFGPIGLVVSLIMAGALVYYIRRRH